MQESTKKTLSLSNELEVTRRERRYIGKQKNKLEKTLSELERDHAVQHQTIEGQMCTITELRQTIGQKCDEAEGIVAQWKKAEEAKMQLQDMLDLRTAQVTKRRITISLLLPNYEL